MNSQRKNRTNTSKFYHPLWMDIGHTYIKVAQYRQLKWHIIKTYSVDLWQDLYQWLETQAEIKTIYTACTNYKLKNHFKTLKHIRFFQSTEIPHHNVNYITPHHYGIDRYLVCVGAHNISQNACVVIDAGTMCTIDYINRQGKIFAGSIMMGLSLLKKTIDIQLPDLPSITPAIPPHFPSKTTLDSMQFGLYKTWTVSIEYFLDAFHKKFGTFQVYITGGDANFIKKYLPNHTFIHNNTLLFEGLKVVVEKYIKG